MLALAQNSKLVMMFLIPVVLVDFHERFEHVFASLRHISTQESHLVSYIVCERMLEVEI